MLTFHFEVSKVHNIAIKQYVNSALFQLLMQFKTVIFSWVFGLTPPFSFFLNVFLL